MKPTKAMVEERRAFLQQWLAKMQPSIELFSEALSPEESARLDLSVESLDVVESWMLRHASNVDEWLAIDPSSTLSALMSGATLYACRVYEHHLPEGHWNVNLEDTKFVGFGSPELCGPDDYPFREFPPIALVIRKRAGTILRDRLQEIKDRTPYEFRGKRRPTRITSERLRTEWLGEVPEALEFFLNWLPTELSSHLDFSPTSLDAIEKWFWTQCQNDKELLVGHYPEITDGAVIYIGEVFLRAFGGKWDITLDKPLQKFNYRPIVVCGMDRKVVVCPILILWSSWGYRKRLLLSKEFSDVKKKLSSG